MGAGHVTEPVEVQGAPRREARATAPAGTAGVLSPAGLISLQRSAGNAAVRALVAQQVQRDPLQQTRAGRRRRAAQAQQLRQISGDRTARVVDAPAMARELRGVLERRLEVAQARLRSPVRNSTNADHVALQQQITRLQSQIFELTTVGHDAAGLRRVQDLGAAAGVATPIRRTDVGTLRSRTNDTEVGPSGITHGRTDVTQTTELTNVQAGQSTTQRTDTRRRQVEIGLEGGSHTNRITSATQAADGTTRSIDQQRTTGVTVGDGSVGATRGNQVTTERGFADGSSTSSTRGVTHGATWGNDGGSITRGANQSTTVRAADGSSRTSESGGSTNLGYVRGEDGTGAAIGTRGNRGSTTTDAEGNVTGTQSGSFGATGQLTNRGGSAGGTLDGSIGRGPHAVSGNVGGNASFRVDVLPVDPDANPITWRIVTRIEFRINGGATGTVNRGPVTGTVGVEGSYSSVETYEHRLTDAEARIYVSNARRIAAGGTAPPGSSQEWDLLSRMRLSNSRGRDRRALDDPAAAARLPVGSSVSLETTYGTTRRAGAGVNGGGLAVGLNTSEGDTTTRTGRVGVVSQAGRRMVEIRLTFIDGIDGSDGGNIGAGGVAAELSTARANSRGREIRIRLDPTSGDYADRFREVVAARTEAAARALQTRFGNAGMVETDEDSTDTSVAVGAAGSGGGVGLGVRGRSRRSHSREVTIAIDDETGQRTLEATTTANSAQTGSIGTGSNSIVAIGSSNATTNRVRTDGRQTVSSTLTQTTNVLTGLPQGMRDALNLTSTRLEQLRLSTGDVDEIGRRARGDDQMWLNSLPGGLMLHVNRSGQWMALKRGLQARAPQHWRDVDEAIAARIVRGEAITRFMSSVDAEDGQRALHVLARGMGGRQLGDAVEWPENISGRGPQFDQLRERVDRARERFRTMTPETRRRDVNDLIGQFNDILGAINECQTFSSPAAKVETATVVRRMISRVLRYRDAAERPAATTPAAGTGAATSGTPAPSATQSVVDDDDDRSLDPITALQTAAQYKRAEGEAWRRVQEAISSANGFFGTNRDAMRAVDILDSLPRTYGPWMAALNAATAAPGQTRESLRRHRPNPWFTATLLDQAVGAGGPTVRNNVDTARRRRDWIASGNWN